MNRRMKTGQSAKGFTLVELLVTMAIALVLLVIAIPNYISARKSSNETATAHNLSALFNAQHLYSSMYGGYAPAYANLVGTPGTAPTCATAGILDPTMWAATPAMGGYNFAAITVPGADNPTDVSQTIGGCVVWHSWSTTATPVSTATGTRSFYLDDGGVIRYSLTGAAGVTSTPLGQ
jgi:prepilin-type N-terminal cleavage/methylation domain-containing protein